MFYKQSSEQNPHFPRIEQTIGTLLSSEKINATMELDKHTSGFIFVKIESLPEGKPQHNKFNYPRLATTSITRYYNFKEGKLASEHYNQACANLKKVKKKQITPNLKSHGIQHSIPQSLVKKKNATTQY